MSAVPLELNPKFKVKVVFLSCACWGLFFHWNVIWLPLFNKILNSLSLEQSRSPTMPHSQITKAAVAHPPAQHGSNALAGFLPAPSKLNESSLASPNFMPPARVELANLRGNVAHCCWGVRWFSLPLCFTWLPFKFRALSPLDSGFCVLLLYWNWQHEAI